jgi:DNA-binding transcriptional regulator YiaG
MDTPMDERLTIRWQVPTRRQKRTDLKSQGGSVMDGLLKTVEDRRLPDPAERRRVREQVGLTQDEIADELGVSRAAV